MTILLICSEKDQASMTFFNILTSELFNFNKINFNLWKFKKNNEIYLYYTKTMHLFLEEKEIIELENENNIKFQEIIFLSKHSTLSEIKPRTISAHAIGNWGKAEYGGKDETLVKTNANLLRDILLNFYLKKPKNIKYEIKQEATHHGPFLNYSVIFVEVGSDVNSWNDKVVCEFICKELLSVVTEYKNEKKRKIAVGVGGSHYCTKFNKFTFDETNEFCFGHIMPNYALKEINCGKKKKQLLKQAREKSDACCVLDEELNEIDID